VELLQDLRKRPNPIKRSIDVRTPKAHIEAKQQTHACRHGWAVPQELVTLTITNRKTGQREFRQVWRDVEHAACPDA